MSEELVGRITARPDVFGGKPIIRDMRISVELVLSLLAQEESWDAILEDYPPLERDDIRACIAYARRAIGRAAIWHLNLAHSTTGACASDASTGRETLS